MSKFAVFGILLCIVVSLTSAQRVGYRVSGGAEIIPASKLHGYLFGSTQIVGPGIASYAGVDITYNGDLLISSQADPGGEIGISNVWIFRRVIDTVTPLTFHWVEEAALLGLEATPAERSSQGFAVSISGDGSYAAVGGPFDNGITGAVWIYKRNAVAQTWSLMTKIVPTDVDTWLGSFVKLSYDGSVLIVGTPTWKLMYVYVRDAVTNSWSVDSTHDKPFGIPVVGDVSSGGVGFSFDITGDSNTIVAGQYTDGSANTVLRIIKRSSASVPFTLAQLINLPGGNFEVQVGISIDGSTIAASTRIADIYDGRLYVLKANGLGVYSVISSRRHVDFGLSDQSGFGYSLAMSDNIVAIGGPGIMRSGVSSYIAMFNITDPAIPKLMGLLQDGSNRIGKKIAMSKGGELVVTYGDGSPSRHTIVFA